MSAGFIRSLEDSGYELVAEGRGRWRILACREHRFSHVPSLVLPAELFDEYVAEVEREGDGSGLSAWALIDVHLEESIRSPSALENTAEVGIRHHRGQVVWYSTLVYPDWFPPAEGVTPAEAGWAMPGDDA
ncbi:hypothetical protein [Microlunatus sp. Y2014]|uniref:hypothetical protein n=1 Tax=Microlunatus sp. Y2014 TaxID=3418488 RepID=UPI003DA6EF66